MKVYQEEKSLGYEFCIFINDICGFSEGINSRGYTICKFDTGQLYLLEPKYCSECPNKFLMTDKTRRVYETRKSG